MSGKLEIVQVTSDVAVGVWQNVLICQFRGAAEMSCVNALRSGLRLAPRGEHAVFLMMIEPASPTPEDAVRKEFAKFLQQEAGTLSTMITMYRGEGFRGALVRAVLAGIDLIARLPFPRHVVDSLDEAARLARKYTPGLDTTELLRAIEALRDTPPTAQAARR